ncbi:MAG: sensor domain-containing diguanylate cyclase, partial [Caldisericaceae bacterium]
ILTQSSLFLIEEFKVNKSQFYFVISPKRNLTDEEKVFCKQTLEYLKRLITYHIKTEIAETESIRSYLLAKRYKMLHSLSNELRSTLTYEQTYWKIVRIAVELFNAQSSSIMDVSGPKKDWHFVALRNIDNETAFAVEKSIKEKMYGENIASIKATKSLNYVADIQDAPGWIETEKSPKSWIGIPIIVKDEVIAVLSIDGEKPHQFDDEDLLFAKAFSTTISDVLQKNIMLEEFSNLSITDALTGLYNRREFDKRIKDEVERAKRYKRPLSIISMDLDKFKELNDTFGHLAGDNVLRAFGEILRKSIRNMDVAFRVGGDEFAIILPETEEEFAFGIAERIRQSLR